MAINFPENPTLEQTFTSGDNTWRWNGFAWAIVPVSSITASDVETTNLTVTGTVTGIDLEDLGNVTISSPADGQVLTWHDGTGDWRPVAPSSGFNGGTITNPLIINNNTVTTNATSGALRVTGGVGIGDDLFVGGTITVEDENIVIRTSGELRFFNTTNTGYVGFSAPNTVSANKIYVLPQSDGSPNHFLKTDGSGNLSWAAVTSPSGGTPAGGTDTAVQYNSNDDFAGNVAFTFDDELLLVTTPNLTATGVITSSDSTESSSTTTGAIKVTGGIGVQGQINVGGASSSFTGNTASTSTTTGTVIVTGGMGVSGAMNVGSTVSADTSPTQASHLTNKRYVDANILAFSVAFGA